MHRVLRRVFPLALALIAIGASSHSARAQASFSWTQFLNYANGTTLARGASHTFDVTFTLNAGSSDIPTLGIGASSTCSTMTPAGPVALTQATTPVTIPITFTANASAPLGNCFITFRTSYSSFSRTSNLFYTIVAGTPQPPVISNISETVTTNAFTVNWSTDIAANGRLEWGTAPGAYTGAPVTNLSQYITTHSLGVSGLAPNTTYYYRVTSCSTGGLCSQSPERSVRTSQATGDTIAPTINPWTYTVGATTVTFDITTDEPSTIRLDYGTSIGYGQVVNDATLSTTHTLAITGLTPLTVYYYQITATDAAGNARSTGTNAANSFTTLAVGQVDRVFTTGACTDSNGNTIPIGQCSVNQEYCHSGGILSADCNFCSFTCSAGQTCRPDGSCTDNQAFSANNPYQCNPLSCYNDNGQFLPSAPQPCQSNFPRCDANVVLKVRPDRVCSQWLTPLSTVTLTNPLTRQREQLSLSLTTCTALDAAGRCSTAAAGNHCQNAPLTLCKTSADCSVGDECVPPFHCSNSVTTACSTDSTCGAGECVSDNLTFFTPKDRTVIRYITGSVTAGMSWAGGRCSVNPDRACSQAGDCQTCSNNPAVFCRQNADCGAGTCGLAANQQCQFDPTYGRCSTDINRACTVNNASTVCAAGDTCVIQSIAGRYPWDLNRQVGVAVPQISNNGFEQVEKVNSGTSTATTFPTRPWEAYGTGASISVVVDPTLVGTTTAGSNHVLAISPSAALDSGAAAPVGGFFGVDNRRYYIALRLRAAGPQRVQVTLGSSPQTGTSIAVYDLTDQWDTKLVPVTSVPTGVSQLFLTCVGTTDCSTTVFYVDDVQIQTSLQVAFQRDQGPTTIIPPSCRLFPKDDSLTCDYTTDGVRYLGQHGYCLQRDPNNDSLCVSWWPVDIIAGDGDFFGTQAKVGYSDRVPLYLCTESRGMANGGLAGGGSNYLSGEVMRWTVQATESRAIALCDPSTAGYTFNDLQAGGVVDNGTFEPALSAPYSPSNASPGQACVDVGSKIGGSAAGVQDDFDIFEEDLAAIVITTFRTADPVGYPQNGTEFRLTRENDWSFLWCANQSNCAPGTTFDDAEKTAWTNLGTATNNEIGAKARFADSGLLNGIKFRMNDASSSTGGIEMRVRFLYREICTKLARVADVTQTKPWASRLASRGYELDALKYRYAQDLAPYGGVVEPDGVDRFDPKQWTAPLNAEAPITDEPLLFSAPQYQSRSGSPYACRGACDVKVCIGGKYNGQVCTTDPNKCRAEVATGSGKGVCQGVGSAAASSKGSQSFSDSVNPTNTYFAQLRAQRVFAQSLGLYEWTHICANNAFQNQQCVSDSQCSVCSNDPTQFCTSANAASVCGAGNTCDPSINACRGAYAIPAGSATNVGWTPPLSRCGIAGGGLDVRPSAFNSAGQVTFGFPTDYCGILPTVTNVQVNGSTTAPPAPLPNSSIVTLSFNFSTDAEQTPLIRFQIDWDGPGGNDAEVFDKTLAPQSDPGNPLVFTHIYAEAGTFTPRIQVQDNWGWCSTLNLSALTRTDSCNSFIGLWVPGPTLIIL